MEQPLYNLQRTDQASFAYDPLSGNVVITNHDNYTFTLGMETLKKLAVAYNDLVREIGPIAIQYRDQETVNDSLRTQDVGMVNSYESLRVVLRKLNKRLYLSWGLYERLRSGNYVYNKEKIVRMDFVNDDLEAVIHGLLVEPSIPIHHMC